MIDVTRKLEVLAVLGYEFIFDGVSWRVEASVGGWPTIVGGFHTERFVESQVHDAAWLDATKRYDLYLHKKGGIYQKQDERPVLDTDLVIVNYEHIHPHERAPGCRLKSEWETPGRFVKITE